VSRKKSKTRREPKPYSKFRKDLKTKVKVNPNQSQTDPKKAYKRMRNHWLQQRIEKEFQWRIMRMKLNKTKGYRLRKRLLKVTKFKISGNPLLFHTSPFLKLV